MDTTDQKLKEFEEKVKQANNAALVDSLIEHTEKSTKYHEVLKIIKKEILERMK